MAITLRTIKGAALTHVELDGNFTDLDTRLDTVETTLLSNPNIGNENIDFGNNLISYSNTVADEASLANYNPNTYTGMTIHVASTGALYYAHSGAWRKLLTDVTYGSPTTQGYVNPLSDVAYTGSFNDLIDVPSVFSFDGSYTSLTNKPTIPQDISELADINTLLFSGSYNDLTNKPAIPTDISTLTDNNNIIPQDVADLTDNSNTIPQDVADLTDNSNTIPQDVADLTDNSSRLATAISQLTNDVGFITSSYIPADTNNWGGTPPTTIPDALDQIVSVQNSFVPSIDQALTTSSNVVFQTVTADRFVSNGSGSPTYSSSADFIFNTGNSSGELTVDGSIAATKILELTAQTSAPVAVSGSFAVADATNWDPASKGSGPYPVFYNGTSWSDISATGGSSAQLHTKFVFTNSQPGSSTANSAYIGETLGTWYECTFANAANTFGLSPDSADRDPTLTGITFNGDRFSGFEQGGTYEFHISPELYERTTNAGIRIHSWEVSTGAFSNMSVYSPGTGSFNINGLSCNDHIVVTFEDATPANNWIRYALDSDQSNIYWIGQAILHIKKIA